MTSTDFFGASPAVAVLVTGAAISAVYAWRLSVVENSRIRQLAEWVRENRPGIWEKVPRHTSMINTSGTIEVLRRGVLARDVEFMARYGDAKAGRKRQYGLIVVSLVLISVIPLGIHFLGWHW